MEQKLKALIVDDEERARLLLHQLLGELEFFDDIRMAGSSASANIELTQFDPDMIFLDIKMPGKDGFAFINELTEKTIRPAIVFVTAYDQFAIKAIRKQAFDYLLKPVNRKELKQCVQKFIETRQIQKAGNMTNGRDEHNLISRIRISTRSGVIFINPSTILYCKADGNYTVICTGEKQHLCSMNIGKVMNFLPENGFIRIGRSHIINVEYVSMLDRKECSVTLERERDLVKVKIPRQHMKDLDKI